jgi:hypothetical protein
LLYRFPQSKPYDLSRFVILQRKQIQILRGGLDTGNDSVGGVHYRAIPIKYQQ